MLSSTTFSNINEGLGERQKGLVYIHRNIEQYIEVLLWYWYKIVR